MDAARLIVEAAVDEATQAPSGATDLVRRCLALFLGGSTVAHVLRPGWFVPMIPDWVPGDPSLVHAAATVAEGTAALLLGSRRTARLGGWAAAAVFVGVFPANVQAVVDGGYDLAPGWLGTRTAAVLRLPLQLPLVLAAVHVARRSRG